MIIGLATSNADPEEVLWLFTFIYYLNCVLSQLSNIEILVTFLINTLRWNFMKGLFEDASYLEIITPDTAHAFSLLARYKTKTVKAKNYKICPQIQLALVSWLSVKSKNQFKALSFHGEESVPVFMKIFKRLVLKSIHTQLLFIPWEPRIQCHSLI